MSHAHVTRDTRVSHTNVTEGVTHLSRSPVPSRPVPTRYIPSASLLAWHQSVTRVRGRTAAEARRGSDAMPSGRR